MKTLAYAAFAVLALVGCSKDTENPTPAVTEKEYTVEYRITSSESAASYVGYDDATGNVVASQNVTLPFTTSFKRKVKTGGVAGSVLASLKGAPTTGTLTGTILLDGKPVKTTTATGASAEVNLNYVVGE